MPSFVGQSQQIRALQHRQTAHCPIHSRIFPNWEAFTNHIPKLVPIALCNSQNQIQDHRHIITLTSESLKLIIYIYIQDPDPILSDWICLTLQSLSFQHQTLPTLKSECRCSKGEFATCSRRSIDHSHTVSSEKFTYFLTKLSCQNSSQHKIIKIRTHKKIHNFDNKNNNLVTIWVSPEFLKNSHILSQTYLIRAIATQKITQFQ